MKLLSKLSLFVGIVLLVAGLAAAAVTWVVATTSGAHWLLTSFSGAGFSVQKVEGRIIDHLVLKHVRVAAAQQKMEVDSLELRWKPLLLLAGTVAVQEMIIRGVKIQDDAPAVSGPPVLSWPKLPGNAQLFDVTINRLRLSEFSYHRQQDKPLQITALNGSVTWQDDLLSVTDLTVLSPDLRIQGAVSAGFTQPLLTANLALVLTHPVADMNQFTLLIEPAKAVTHEVLAGTISLSGAAGEKKLLELTGEAGMAKSAFNLRQFRLRTPGRNGSLTADGSLELTAQEPVMTVKITASGLDLAPELNVPTDLSGILRFSGTLEKYRGDFTLANRGKGWQAMTVSSAYTGTRETVKLAPLTATVIDGKLAGNLDIDWHDGIAVQGAINGRNLNPARLDPKWTGNANFNATGSVSQAGKLPLSGSIRAKLLESTLHGQSLKGEVQAEFTNTSVNLDRLILKGKGFDLRASGDLEQRLALSAQVSDLSRLAPGSAGVLQGEGWVRWRNRQLSGEVTASGSGLAYSGTRIKTATLAARLRNGPGYPGTVNLSLQDVIYDSYMLDSASIIVDGSLPHHTVHATVHSGINSAEATLSAGYRAAAWKGTITALTGQDSVGLWTMTAPAIFSVSSERVSLSPLTLISATREHLEVATDLTLNPLTGGVRAHWSDLNLDRANPYLKDARMTGSSSGSVRVGFLPGKQLTLAGSATGSGTFTGSSGSISIERSLVTFDGSEKGMRAALEVDEASGARLKGTFVSPAPLLFALPEKGKLTMEFSGVDGVQLKPWLPADTVIEGRFNGRAGGILLPGQRFELDGSASLFEGAVHKGGKDGLNLTFSAADASWRWRGEVLSGTLALNMAGYGQTRANFHLPIPARYPIAVIPNGPLQAAVNGQFQEQGIVSALFPGLVQKSFGTLDVRLTIGGTWEAPQVGGTAQLAKAGAYLPTAGVHLTDIQLGAVLEKDLIRIESFRAVSGSGHIDGSATVTLSGWQVINYRGMVRGEKFQILHLPEFRVQAAPDLTFEGTPQKLTVRGELRLPLLQLDSAPATPVITPSGDIIREGIIVSDVQSSPLELDVKIRVLLGDRVFVKVAGIDAQLGGAVEVSMTGLDKITSAGEIKVIKGRYRTYGVNLDIVRGRLFFAGGPADHPALDFLALRTIGDIRAGVTVSGSLQKPVAKLYSEPAMPDVDVLAYIVLGHPLDSTGEQSGLMTQAAGALLTSGQAADVQQLLKDEFGLSTLEIQGGVGASGGSMGYKPLQVTAPGTIPTAMQSGITETVLTVGKYLTPKLYVSYGKSLFTGSNLFLLRYDIFKKWQIETQTGAESGVDLFYKLEFK